MVTDYGYVGTYATPPHRYLPPGAQEPWEAQEYMLTGTGVGSTFRFVSDLELKPTSHVWSGGFGTPHTATPTGLILIVFIIFTLAPGRQAGGRGDRHATWLGLLACGVLGADTSSSKSSYSHQGDTRAKHHAHSLSTFHTHTLARLFTRRPRHREKPAV